MTWLIITGWLIAGQEMTWLIIIGWLIAGAVVHGLNFGYFQRQYPILAAKEYWHDMFLSLPLSFLCPPAALASFYMCGFHKFKHGLKFW
jgi:hypothetical protein